MKPFGVSCAANGCDARSSALLGENPVGWRNDGPFMYCAMHVHLVPSTEPVPPAPPPPPAPSADAVLDATTKLVADVLGSGNRLRFAQAEKLCRLAHAMQGVLEPAVEDFLKDDGELHEFPQVGQVVGGGGLQMRRWDPRRVNAVANGDQGEMIRGMMAMLERVVAPQSASHEAQAAEAEVRELGLLMDLPDDVRDKFWGRIDTLTKRINSRKEQPDEVVHPELERRLQSGGSGEGQDALARLGPDVGREGRVEVAVEEGLRRAR